MKIVFAFLILLTAIETPAPTTPVIGARMVTVVSGGGGTYPTGLTALWHLDEGSGTTRNDSVGANNLTDVTTVGSATGKINNAAQYAASNTTQELTRTSTADLSGYTDWTFGFWCNLSDTSANHGIVGKGAQDAYLEFVFSYNSGTDSIQLAARDLGISVVGTTTFTATNVWHFVCGGYDSVASKFWLSVDNQGTRDESGVVAANTTTTGTLKLGHGFGNWMEGMIDNSFWYKNVSLTSGNISTIYNGGAGLAGP